jgi:hypothetical protein
MKGLRVAVTVVVILLWGLFVPLALASNACPMMSSMCEGPCGALQVASAPVAAGAIEQVTAASPTPIPVVLTVAPAVLDPPPKLPALSA